MSFGFARRVRRQAGDRWVDQIDVAFWLSLGRPVAREELALCIEYLRDQESYHARQDATKGGASASVAALADLCLSIMNLNEFIYLE